jgi:hypothetical protein
MLHLNRVDAAKRREWEAAGFDYEVVEKVYRPHDNLALAADLRADGGIQVELVGSIAETLRSDSDLERLQSDLRPCPRFYCRCETGRF